MNKSNGNNITNKKINNPFPIGCKISSWTVASSAYRLSFGPKQRKKSVVDCRCICGKSRPVDIGCLKSGSSKSCGCVRNQAKKLHDLTGHKFGRILVKSLIPESIVGKRSSLAKWICECECGSIREVWGYSLRGNQTLSCGCYKQDQRRKLFDSTPLQLALNNCYSMYRRSALDRNIKFELEKSDFF